LALNPQILGLAHNGLFSRDEDIKDIFQKSRDAANYVKAYRLLVRRIKEL